MSNTAIATFRHLKSTEVQQKSGLATESRKNETRKNVRFFGMRGPMMRRARASVRYFYDSVVSPLREGGYDDLK